MSSNHELYSPLTYGAVLEILDELPTAMRVIRRVRRLSASEAGEEIGISAQTVGDIESGEVNMRLSTFRLIIAWLNSQPEVEFHQAANEREAVKHERERRAASNGRQSNSGGRS